MRLFVVLLAGVTLTVVVAWWMAGTEQPLRSGGAAPTAPALVAKPGADPAREAMRRATGVVAVEDPEATVAQGPRQPVVFRIVDGRSSPVEGATVHIGSVDTGVRSDADGRISGSDILRRLRAPGSAVPVRAAVLGAVGEPVTVDIATAALPIELRAPDCGVLEVALVDGGGAPWPSGPGAARVRVGLRPLDADRPVTTVDAGLGALVRIEPVAVGRRYELGVVLGEAVVEIVDGPRFAGEVRRVMLGAAPELPMLTGRVLAKDGLPWTGPLLVEVSSHERAVGGAWLDLGDDGRFVLALHRGHLRGSTFLWLRTSSDGSGHVAVVDHGGPLESGIHDLGVLRLAPAALVAGGVVLDAGGEPASGAHLRLRFRLGEDAAWRPVAAPTRRIGDGRFEVRDAVVPGAVYEIGASFDLAWHGFRLGAADLVLAPPARAPGVVGIGVRSEPELPRGTLLVCVQQDGGPAVVASLENRGIESLRGGWRWYRALGVEPGIHRVSIRVASAGEVAAVDEVVVAADGSCADPRLAAIDLRGRLMPFTLTVRSADGVPLPDAGFRLWGRATDRVDAAWRPLGFRRRFDDRGSDLWTAIRGTRLWITADGHRGREWIVNGPTADVTLEPAPVVWFSPPAELRDAATRGRVHLMLEPVDQPAHAPGSTTTRAIDPDGWMRVAVPCDADHRVSLRWQPDGAPERELPILPPVCAAVHLVDGARIPLVLAPEAVRQFEEPGERR